MVISTAKSSNSVQSAEVATTSREKPPIARPYLFTSESGQIWRVVPISPTVPAVCPTIVSASTEVENSTTTPPDLKRGLLVLSYSTSTPQVESGEGVVSSGTIVQVLDYYPYGANRINSSIGSDTKKKFAGMDRDTQTGLDYAMARYYNNTQGQFTSQDPVFWEIGLTPDGKTVLNDPQLQNSYSWGRDNPITQKDPTGRSPLLTALALLFAPVQLQADPVYE